MQRAARRSPMVSILVLGLMLPLPAMAQTHAGGTGSNPGARAGASQSAIAVVSARQLLNRPLRDAQGHDAGRVNGVVLNTANGAVDFVTVAGRGNFHLNGEVIALPWAAIMPTENASGPITLKIAAAKLEKAPRLNPDEIAALEQQRTRAGIYGYYGYRYWPYAGPDGRYAFYRPGQPRYIGSEPNTVGPPVGAGETTGSGGTAGSGAGGGPGNVPANIAGGPISPAGRRLAARGLAVGPSGVVAALWSKHTASAQAMRSAAVYTRKGKQIGHIDRVLIDPRRGEVALVLIKEGGFLGLSQKWFTVPIEALRWTSYRGGYRLMVSARALTQEPAVPVNEKNLPTRLPERQLAQLYEDFNVTPYWRYRPGQSAAGRVAPRSTAQSGASQPQSTQR